MNICQSLGQVAAHAVVAALECVDGEEAHMFQAYGVAAVEEYAQLCLVVGLVGLQPDFIFLPFGRFHVESDRSEILVFAHRGRVDKLYGDAAGAFGRLCPYGETIFFAFLHSYAEVSFVDEAGAAFHMLRVGEHHIMGAALERSVGFQFDIAECLPSHETLGKFKRAVLDQFSIQSAVGGIVDIFEEQAVHGVLYRGSGFLRVYVHHVCVLGKR